MDVDRDNFSAVFPAFVELLATSKFVSFDEEMTGIFGQGEGSQKRDDTVEERYKKMVTVATKYGIIQFGICLFHDSADGTALVATPYNFYIFPNSRDDLVVSPSAIDFLRKNKMNFDQWLTKGITYVAAEGEQWAKKKFFPDTAAAPTDEIPKEKELIKLTRPSDIEFIDRNMARVEAMLTSTDCNAEGTGAGDSVALESTNAFLRRVLYEQLEARYAGRVNVVKNEQNILSVLKVDPAKQADFELAQRLEKERQFNETLGFRRVFNALVESKKPLVGHNLFFDLLFMMRWLDGPLAEDFGTFRARLNEMFPAIYDTKLIAEKNIDGVGNIDTGLERCYQHFVKERPFNAFPAAAVVTDLTAMEGVTGTGTEGVAAPVPVVLRSSGVEIRMSPLITGFDPEAAQFHNAGTLFVIFVLCLFPFCCSQSSCHKWPFKQTTYLFYYCATCVRISTLNLALFTLLYYRIRCLCDWLCVRSSGGDFTSKGNRRYVNSVGLLLQLLKLHSLTPTRFLKLRCSHYCMLSFILTMYLTFFYY